MKSRLKKITIFLLVFLFIFAQQSQQHQKQQVKATMDIMENLLTLVQIKIQQIKKIKSFKEIRDWNTCHSLFNKWTVERFPVDGKTGYVFERNIILTQMLLATLEGTTYDKGQTVAQFAQRFVGNSLRMVEQT